MSSAAHSSDLIDEDSLFGPPPSQPAAVSTAALITAMLDSGKGISDLVQVEVPRRIVLNAPVVTKENVDQYMPLGFES